MSRYNRTPCSRCGVRDSTVERSGLGVVLCDFCRMCDDIRRPIAPAISGGAVPSARRRRTR